MESAGTGVAAVRCNRQFIGMERDTEFFDAASDRIKIEECKMESALTFTE